VYGFAMAIALKYSRDNTDAKDILSHSFVKVFKSITSFDAAKGSFHAWLKKIIFNEAIDHIKQRSRFSNVEFEKAEEPHIESTVIEKMDEAEVMALVQQLPPATHAVFVMYVVDGYPHKEIAEKLKISEGTSKWHLSEARKLLQQKLINLKN
jgi:RNA polymerase sigma factor (sigma-70 family)